METDPDDYIMYWHLMQGNPRQPSMLNSRLWILGSRGGLILSVELYSGHCLSKITDSTAEDFMDFTSKISRILEPGLPYEGSKPRGERKMSK